MSTRTWLATDYYELLGVGPDATADEITRAFRASAKDQHPDRTDDADARERFKALSAAYGVLGNAERRSRYDRLRTTPPVPIRPTPTSSAEGFDPSPTTCPDLETDRPLSVRALPDRRHGRWATIGGIALLVVGLLAIGLVGWLVAAGPDGTANGSDPTGRNLTLGLVALKLIVVGIAFVVLGNRRQRYP